MKYFITAVCIAAISVLCVGTDADASQEIKLRGRFHMDAGWHNDDKTELYDGFNNRRARIGVKGKFNPDWSFIIEYDFAENGTSAKDIMMSSKIGEGVLKVGQYKVPMGLNELTSSNSITFIERASNSTAIVDSRRMGIGYDYHAKQFGVQTMIFGRAIGKKQTDREKDGDMPYGFAGRVYANPLSGDMNLHIGGSAAYVDYNNGYRTLRFRDRPEARADAPVRLIDTGTITDVDTSLKMGLELAFQYGPFSLEGEYLAVNIGRLEGEEPKFAGYHVQASYVLTGESRGYRGGVFRGVTPKNNSWGALEAAVRYSSINLTDEDAGIEGGKQDNITIGLNYYANSNVRFMVNYIMVNVTDRDPSKIEDGEDSPKIILARAQFNF